MSTTQQKSFVISMLEFFGTLPGQTKTQFASELKALSPEDKAYFHAGLAACGIDCAAPLGV